MICNWNIKDSITPETCIKYQTQAKQDTEIKRSNALISKQKEEGWQEQLLPKKQKKKVSC